jgi:serine/threonine protein kinase
MNSSVRSDFERKVIKKLGHGVMGTTYLIEINKKKYICKIEKIWEADIKPRMDIPLWREIRFADFCKEYPDHFMQLKSWEILDGCKHKQSDPEWKMDSYSLHNWKLRNESPYCSKLIYEPVFNGTLQSVLNILNLNQLKSAIAQVVYAVGLMIKAGFIHRDLHCNNIMYKKTKKKSMMLGSYEIKTTLQWYLIDYGSIIHPDYITPNMHKEQRKEEKQMLNNPHFDLAVFLFQTINMPVWNMIAKHNLFDKIPTEQQLVSKIKKTSEFVNLIKYLPPLEEPIVIRMCIMMVFLLHHPQKYHELMGFGSPKFKKMIMDYSAIKDMYCQIIRRLAKPNLIVKYLTKPSSDFV